MKSIKTIILLYRHFLGHVWKIMSYCEHLILRRIKKKKTFARNNGWVVEGLRAMTYEYYLVERKVAQPGDEWHKVIWRIMNERKRLKFLLWSFYGHVAETGYRCSEMRNKHIVFLGTELKLYFPAILTVRWGCVIDFWSMV